MQKALAGSGKRMKVVIVRFKLEIRSWYLYPNADSLSLIINIINCALNYITNITFKFDRLTMLKRTEKYFCDSFERSKAIHYGLSLWVLLGFFASMSSTKSKLTLSILPFRRMTIESWGVGNKIYIYYWTFKNWNDENISWKLFFMRCSCAHVCAGFWPNASLERLFIGRK